MPQNISGEEFLVQLKKESGLISTNVAVVVAHQDDESIAFGAQLPRFPNCLVVHVTDGAPYDQKEWLGKGFVSRQDYAVTRWREAQRALDLTGHQGQRAGLRIVDQKAPLAISGIATILEAMFERENTQVVLTHAYEGGHPDHDATAFAVHLACRLLRKKGRSLAVLEAPLYHMQGKRLVWQHFVAKSGPRACLLKLSTQKQALKRQLYEAHDSQKDCLSDASVSVERIRVAPGYDFTKRASRARRSSLFKNAGLSEKRWTELSKRALRLLRL